MKITKITTLDLENFIGTAHLEDENGDSRGVIPCRLAPVKGTREHRDENPEAYSISYIPNGDGGEYWIAIPKEPTSYMKIRPECTHVVCLITREFPAGHPEKYVEIMPMEEFEYEFQNRTDNVFVRVLAQYTVPKDAHCRLPESL